MKQHHFHVFLENGLFCSNSVLYIHLLITCAKFRRTLANLFINCAEENIFRPARQPIIPTREFAIFFSFYCSRGFGHVNKMIMNPVLWIYKLKMKYCTYIYLWQCDVNCTLHICVATTSFPSKVGYVQIPIPGTLCSCWLEDRVRERLFLTYNLHCWSYDLSYTSLLNMISFIFKLVWPKKELIRTMYWLPI
jgi:hypothetical protein